MNNETSSKFTATLSKGRRKWCVIFQHPLIPDPKTGKPGKRVRKGLGTEDKEMAELIIKDLNAILSDKDLLKVAAREEAERRFGANSKAVSAFYDNDSLRPAIADPMEKRNAITLPTSADGYAVAQFVGAFGVGKTTLIRQLLGTDPDKERFPSTAKGKTTTCDLEVVCANGDFQAAVSFMSRDRTRDHVEECVEAAVLAAAEGEGHASVVRKFMTHSEERFRLAYILGKAVLDDCDEEDEDEEDEEENKENVVEGTVTDEERRCNADKLNEWIRRCEEAAFDSVKKLEKESGESAAQLTQKDREAFLQLVEERLDEDEIIQEIVDEVMESIEFRFASLQSEGMSLDRSGWPIHWFYSTEPENRKSFLRKVSRFSSNNSSYYGKLLTPVVDGIRVKGPFKPEGWSVSGEIPRLVLLDGEGLGHVSGTATSVPISVLKKINMVDAIVLADRSDTRMSAAPQALLRAVATSGNTRKLAVVFTHFDRMKGDTFDNDADKRDYILASLEQAIGAVENDLSSQSGAGRRLREHLRNATFFVSKIDRKISEKAKATRRALNGLVEFIVAAGKPEAPTEATPVYDLAYLFPEIEKATKDYRESWRALMATEHWKRVQALTRRFAKQSDDKYLHLQPVADLRELLSDNLAKFVSSPKEWVPANAAQEIKDAAVEKVARAATVRLIVYLSRKFREEKLREWCAAYGRSGIGSGYARAKDVLSIEDDVATVPSESRKSELFDDMRKIFREAIETAGGKIVA